MLVFHRFNTVYVIDYLFLSSSHSTTVCLYAREHKVTHTKNRTKPQYVGQ